MSKTHAERFAKWKAKNRPHKPLLTKECITRISNKIDAIFYGRIS